MRYTIAYNKGGRIRLRLKVFLTNEDAAGLNTLLHNLEGVKSVNVTAVNSGVLIYCS